MIMNSKVKFLDSTEKVVIFAPEDAHEFRAVPLLGETRVETELADRAFQAILDNAGFRTTDL